jgi:hypothetical protein
MGSRIESREGLGRSVVLATLVAGLVVATAGILGYACLLLLLARSRGKSFFLPGFVAGAVGFLILFVGIQYARDAIAGSASGRDSLIPAAIWLGPLGIGGAWFAARSVLKRLRRDESPALQQRVVLQTAGAFVVGVGVIALIQLVALVAMPPVSRR